MQEKNWSDSMLGSKWYSNSVLNRAFKFVPEFHFSDMISAISGYLISRNLAGRDKNENSSLGVYTKIIFSNSSSKWANCDRNKNDSLCLFHFCFFHHRIMHIDRFDNNCNNYVQSYAGFHIDSQLTMLKRDARWIGN